MKVAVLESIVMPAGHEVEFDRILVDELSRQGHEPVMLVPQNFPFKIKYQAKVDYLSGGEVVTYAGADKFQKLLLSVKREYRRKKWFDSAYVMSAAKNYDALIIPTATYRYLRTLLNSDLKNSKIPVYIIFHGINPKEKANFVKQARKCLPYKNIHLKVITLRNDFVNDNLPNVDLIAPPVFKPLDLPVDKNLTYREPLKLGFFGQYRREKNVRFFLDAFKQAHFTIPVKLIMQGATARTEDSEEFEKIIEEYRAVPGIEFWHKNLIGEEWQRALLGVDVIIAPYAAERYRYHWSAMSFTAIGFYKPILQSPEMNPEVLQNYNVGEAVALDALAAFTKQLENFVNTYPQKHEQYKEGLAEANIAFSHENLLKAILR
ncbi:MAG: glycosyltransferase family 1 protein [Phascolarctobacterium sp.]|uniref:glycosyltransferase family 1 protein n=1 Tax=Phascolarctobacterium sp. TaxID=2049039 RepID=UPI0026DAEBB7|nr:glycosyltransferase family 1 protein [Phascolarctobacterium sp.]MDO4920613.1 glycosyltransferase family 1 protein [Phascolarctobacterium sp.]